MERKPIITINNLQAEQIIKALKAKLQNSNNK